MSLTYQTFGPFELERDGNKIRREAFSDLWVDVERSEIGLSYAVGVYIFAVQTKGKSTLRPWYVGRTDKQGFRGRFNQQRGKFGDVLDFAKSGTPQIFLLARVTPTGDFVKPTTKNKLSYNDELESLLIGSCLARNSHLINASKVKHLRDLSVPGYRNNKQGKPKQAARDLASMLGSK